MNAPLWGAEKPLRAYSADAIKLALDEAVLAYQRETGLEVKVTYGKTKEAFAQAKQEKGDLYFSGHADAYEAAKKEGLALEGSQRVIGFLTVAIAVPKGNPLKIAALADLAKPGVKVGLGDPNTSQLGRVSEELLQKGGMAEAVHRNVVARGSCCSEVAALLTSGKVEAVLGWTSFAKGAPDKVETVPLPADLAKPLPVTGLVLTTSENPRAAARFLAFLRSRKGRAIFAKYGYARRPQGQSTGLRKEKQK
jgi:molybdate transport system substrate-binding protein